MNSVVDTKLLEVKHALTEVQINLTAERWGCSWEQIYFYYFTKFVKTPLPGNTAYDTVRGSKRWMKSSLTHILKLVLVINCKEKKENQNNENKRKVIKKSAVEILQSLWNGHSPTSSQLSIPLHSEAAESCPLVECFAVSRTIGGLVKFWANSMSWKGTSVFSFIDRREKSKLFFNCAYLYFFSDQSKIRGDSCQS